MLTEVYGVASASVGYYLLPFAVGNFMGPLLLGRFFDTVGRKPMIAGTYILSGILLIVTGILFRNGTLDATTQTVARCVIFFFASAGASAADLTVSEIFLQATMGVEAAQRDLEDIAPPLSAQQDELEEPGEEADPYTIGRDEGRGTAHAPRFSRTGTQEGAEAPPASRTRPSGGDR